MTAALERDLESLARAVVHVAGLVEEAIDRAITALNQRRADLARHVLDGDPDIDDQEVEIEQDCLRILALHHPVATDLRFVVTVLKVNNDLERMGDLAVNIATRAAALAQEDPLGVEIDLASTGATVRDMVRDAIDALMHRNSQLAREVICRDDAVDRANERTFRVVQDHMTADPESIGRGVSTLSASRHLERIADLATNIAEDVIFLTEGSVIRHREA